MARKRKSRNQQNDCQIPRKQSRIAPLPETSPDQESNDPTRSNLDEDNVLFRQISSIQLVESQLKMETDFSFNPRFTYGIHTDICSDCNRPFEKMSLIDNGLAKETIPHIDNYQNHKQIEFRQEPEKMDCPETVNTMAETDKFAHSEEFIPDLPEDQSMPDSEMTDQIDGENTSQEYEPSIPARFQPKLQIPCKNWDSLSGDSESFACILENKHLSIDERVKSLNFLEKIPSNNGDSMNFNDIEMTEVPSTQNINEQTLQILPTGMFNITCKVQNWLHQKDDKESLNGRKVFVSDQQTGPSSMTVNYAIHGMDNESRSSTTIPKSLCPPCMMKHEDKVNEHENMYHAGDTEKEPIIDDSKMDTSNFDVNLPLSSIKEEPEINSQNFADELQEDSTENSDSSENSDASEDSSDHSKTDTSNFKVNQPLKFLKEEFQVNTKNFPDESHSGNSGDPTTTGIASEKVSSKSTLNDVTQAREDVMSKPHIGSNTFLHQDRKLKTQSVVTASFSGTILPTAQTLTDVRTILSKHLMNELMLQNSGIPQKAKNTKSTNNFFHSQNDFPRSIYTRRPTRKARNNQSLHKLVSNIVRDVSNKTPTKQQNPHQANTTEKVEKQTDDGIYSDSSDSDE